MLQALEMGQVSGQFRAAREGEQLRLVVFQGKIIAAFSSHRLSSRLPMYERIVRAVALLLEGDWSYYWQAQGLRAGHFEMFPVTGVLLEAARRADEEGKGS